MHSHRSPLCLLLQAVGWRRWASSTWRRVSTFPSTVNRSEVCPSTDRTTVCCCLLLWTTPSNWPGTHTHKCIAYWLLIFRLRLHSKVVRTVGLRCFPEMCPRENILSEHLATFQIFCTYCEVQTTYINLPHKLLNTLVKQPFWGTTSTVFPPEVTSAAIKNAARPANQPVTEGCCCLHLTLMVCFGLEGSNHLQLCTRDQHRLRQQSTTLTLTAEPDWMKSTRLLSAQGFKTWPTLQLISKLYVGKK